MHLDLSKAVVLHSVPRKVLALLVADSQSLHIQSTRQSSQVTALLSHTRMPASCLYRLQSMTYMRTVVSC